jgi:hypothetical protein
MAAQGSSSGSWSSSGTRRIQSARQAYRTDGSSYQHPCGAVTAPGAGRRCGGTQLEGLGGSTAGEQLHCMACGVRVLDMHTLPTTLVGPAAGQPAPVWLANGAWSGAMECSGLHAMHSVVPLLVSVLSSYNWVPCQPCSATRAAPLPLCCCIQVQGLVEACCAAVEAGHLPWAALVLRPFEHVPSRWSGSRQQLEEGWGTSCSQVLLVLPEGACCLMTSTTPRQVLR